MTSRSSDELGKEKSTLGALSCRLTLPASCACCVSIFLRAEEACISNIVMMLYFALLLLLLLLSLFSLHKNRLVKKKRKD